MLTRAQCLTLAASAPIGRIVFTSGALPAIWPVNFVLDDDAVVLRTGAGSKLAAAVRSAIVAFQVDHFDEAAHGGWSVTVTGRAEAVSDPAEIARLGESCLASWVPEERQHWIRISADLVTGRRILARTRPAGPDAPFPSAVDRAVDRHPPGEFRATTRSQPGSERAPKLGGPLR